MSKWKWQLLSRKRTMAPHSSTLSWKIPWTEEPDRLQSMGSLELDTTKWLHFYFSLSCIGEGNGNPLQRSCLENPRDGGAWWAAVYGVTQSRTWLKRLRSSSSNLWNGVPRWHSGKEFACQLRRYKRHRFKPWVGKIPWSGKMATHSSILAWKIPWTEEPGGLSSMGSESDTTERLSTHAAQPPMEQCIQTTRQP